MIDISLGLLPVFLLIALGAALKRAAFPGEAFWPLLEKLVYFVLFPPLLIHTIATSSLEGDEALRLGGAFIFSISVMAALTLALRPLLPISGPAFSSVFQGAIRWNAYVVLGSVSLLLGPRGVALSAVAFAAMVPVANVLSVLVLSRYARETPAAAGVVLKALAGNPLIIACVTGTLLAASGIALPGAILAAFKSLGDATVALGLIAVGAALDLKSARAAGLPIVVAGVLKLALMPALAYVGCLIFGVTGDARIVAIACAAAPPATSAYILARQLGGDATLMANMLTALTLFSAITIPLAIALLA